VALDPYLPVIVPAAIGLVVVSAIAALALTWTRDPSSRRLIGRAWVAFAVLAGLGVAIFWIATAMAPGSRGLGVDRGLQNQEAKELHDRLEKGGH